MGVRDVMAPGVLRSGFKSRTSGDEGWVYGWARGGEIKVGYTTDRDVDKYLSRLQRGQPDEMVRVFAQWVHDPYRVEQTIHALLAHRHVRREWYRVTASELVKAYETATDGRLGLWAATRCQLTLAWHRVRDTVIIMLAAIGAVTVCAAVGLWVADFLWV